MDNKLIVVKDNWITKVKKIWHSFFRKKENNEYVNDLEIKNEEKRNLSFIKGFLDTKAGDRISCIETLEDCSIEELKSLKQKYEKSIAECEIELENYKKRILIMKDRLN